MPNIKYCIDHVLEKATRSRSHTFALRTLTDARPAVTGKSVTVTSLGDQSIPSHKVTVGDASGHIQVNMGTLHAVAAMISGTAFARTQYGNSADDVLYRALYNVAERDLLYYDNGNQLTKRVTSAPCMICGLVLPLPNLTIDHQRPQEGGALEAIAKVFRIFGLTKEGPQGQKGQLIQAYLKSASPQYGAIGTVPPKPGRAAPSGTSLSDRYTLNDEGALLYSFVVEAGQSEALKTNCMNSVMNLRPACAICNSSRGNPLKFPQG